MRTTRTGIGILACALAVGFAAPLRADDAKPPTKELAWVPADSVGVVHVRFAELWNSKVGKDVAKLLNSLDPKTLAQFERETGLPLGRIDRVTLAFFAAIGERELLDGCAIRVHTTRPYDRRDIVAAINRGGQKNELSANRDLFPVPGGGMVHFTDDRTITLIPKAEGAYALLGGLLSKSKTGAMSSALALAGANNHFVASVDVTKLPRIPVDEIPPEFKPLRPLLDTKTATLIGNLREDVAQFELQLKFEDKADAADGRQSLDEAVKLALKSLDESERGLAQAKEQNKAQLEILKEVRAALTAVKIEQTDATVRATTEIRVAQIMTKLLADGASAIRTSADRTKSTNNIKQMSLALINYADTYAGAMPAAAITDKNGKPLLSWRVAILPYIEQDQLYKQFKLDEPWDSEHNLKLIKQMPMIYRLPGDNKKYEYPSTYYQAFVGPHAAFEPNVKVMFPASFSDGTSNTIWLAEAADPVPWTKPEDITYEPKKMPKVGFHFGDRCNVGFADGSVRALKKKLDESIWHLLIQRDDGMVIPNYDD